MPTGIALRDARERLFDAAEQVLLRDGASALTSRAVTTEAGVAKGVIHRHFDDFDGFLAELVLDRVARLEGQASVLLDSTGIGSVADNLTGALINFFGPVAVAIVGLVISRDGLRSRLRQSGAARLPLIAEAATMIRSYLSAEQELGRVAVNADVDTLATTLIASGHLLFADREGPPPDAVAIHRIVMTIIAGVVSRPSPRSAAGELASGARISGERL
jgi:AcrR family transcriptional regulator